MQFNNQGYEYVDLGRSWEIYLFIGLILWVVLVLRALWPVLQDQASGIPGLPGRDIYGVHWSVIRGRFDVGPEYPHQHQSQWQEAYYWPSMFFAAVLVWNMIGAGLFGFLINPPIALYYMQGLNTTANHGHAALFGAYGMLGIGLMLFCMRGLTDTRNWNQKYLKISFWSLNIGLAMMTFMSLLPQGLWQTYASIKHYYAFARSAEFVHSTIMEGLVWARVPGDIVFAVGVGALAMFVFQAFWKPVSESASESVPERPVPSRHP